MDDSRKEDMADSTAEKLIASLLDYNEKYAHFTWIGGEPLLRNDSFFESIRNFQKRSNNKNLLITNSIQTNGILLDHKRKEYLGNLGFRFGSSYDGCLDLQDALRITKNGNKVGEKVLENIRSANKSLSLISVLTKNMIGREEEVYSNLKNLGRRARVNFYTPSGHGLGMKDELLPSKEETQGSMRKFYELWKGDKDNFVLDPFDGLVQGFFLGWPKTCEYSAYSCYRIISSDPRGMIYMCPRSTHIEETKLGNIHENSIKDIVGSVAHNLVLDRYFNLKEGDCKGCEWISMCSGGCPVESISNHGDIMKKTYYCQVKKSLFEIINNDLKNDELKSKLARKVGLIR